MAPDDDAMIGIAAALGGHALAVWAAFVALVLLVAVLAWRWQRRRPTAAPGAEPAAPTGVAWRVGVGFVLIVAAAALFDELAEGLQAGARLGRFDEAFALGLRGGTPAAALRAFAAVTHAGDPSTLTVLGVVVGLALLLSRRRALAAGWVAAVLGNALLNTTLKSVFMRARPVHDGVRAAAEGYSFPSGHTSGALVAYGMLAYLAVRVLAPAWHLPALCLAIVLALTTAFSRVFIGVHYASDVLAGTLSGGAWLVVCIAAVELHRRRRARLGG